MPDGIAVDWIADNIYFTESRGGRIDVVNLEGRFRRVLVDNLSSPRGLAVDPSQRCVDNVHLHFLGGWGGAGAVLGVGCWELGGGSYSSRNSKFVLHHFQVSFLHGLGFKTASYWSL